jgi:hypothetical protein
VSRLMRLLHAAREKTPNANVLGEEPSLAEDAGFRLRDSSLGGQAV